MYSWDEDMVRAYYHNSELQRRWAFSLMSKVSVVGDEKILDIGCGDGKITADISRLVPKGWVHGEDLSGVNVHHR